MTERNVLFEILDRVSEREGRDVTELPPIGNRIDADALVSLVESGVNRVEFEYLEYRVVIRDGEVELRERGG